MEYCVSHHTVAALPRWEPETVACEPETVNRKGLQAEASLALKKPGFERAACAKLQKHKTGAWKLCHPLKS
jgi:hypothetical protein